MDATDLFDLAWTYIVRFAPIIFVLAVISVADLIIDFMASLLKRAPDFGVRGSGRRTR